LARQRVSPAQSVDLQRVRAAHHCQKDSVPQVDVSRKIRAMEEDTSGGSAAHEQRGQGGLGTSTAHAVGGGPIVHPCNPFDGSAFSINVNNYALNPNDIAKINSPR